MPVSGASAVVLNVTAVTPSASSWLTVWPAGETRPLASNLNYTPNVVVANQVVVKLSSSGAVSLYNQSGSVDLVVDVAGWYGDPTTQNGSPFVAATAARILDTRDGGDAAKLGAGSTINLQVTGRGGVPATGVSAVALNVTVVDVTAPGYSYLTAWPTGESRPLASNMNYSSGAVLANMVVVKVGANGQVSFFNATGSTHLVVDVAGWYT